MATGKLPVFAFQHGFKPGGKVIKKQIFYLTIEKTQQKMLDCAMKKSYRF